MNYCPTCGKKIQKFDTIHDVGGTVFIYLCASCDTKWEEIFDAFEQQVTIHKSEMGSWGPDECTERKAV